MKINEILKKVDEALCALETVKTALTTQTFTEAPAKAEKATKTEKKETKAEAGYTKEELEELSYNELKALVSKAGQKAVGKKPDLINILLGVEKSEDGDVSAPVEKKGSTSTAGKSKKVVEDDTDEAEEEGEDDSEEIDNLIEQISDLELDELKEIAKKAGVTTKGKDKKKLLEALSLVPEKLDKALEELGYYDEEEETEEEDTEMDDEVDTDEEGGDDEEDGYELADILASKETEELADILTEAGLSKKGKKQALIDRILEAVENGTIEITDIVDGIEEDADSEEEEEGEWYSQEEFEAMTLTELKELAEEYEVEVPMKKVKGKSVVDKDALIEALLALAEADEEEGEEAVTDDEEEEFEASEERLEAEDKIEKNIRAQYAKKKLKDNDMKKFLADYFDGDPDCSGCKGCSNDERLNCYIEVQKNFVDDEGEIHENEDYYVRDGVGFCCGVALEEVDGVLSCAVCGAEYEEDEE